ncbi:MAG: Translin family protein, partial [uncultured Thermomicrobiales bacterium]
RTRSPAASAAPPTNCGRCSSGPAAMSPSPSPRAGSSGRCGRRSDPISPVWRGRVWSSPRT